MFQLTEVIQPKPNEQVEGMFRRHRLTLFLPLLIASMGIILPFLFLFTLWHKGVVGIVIFFLVLLSSVGIAWRSLFLWDANVLLITNQRVVYVQQLGIWHRTVQEVLLSSLHELGCDVQGMAETLLRIGTLRLRASGSAQEILIPKLAAPEKARTLIQRLREQSSLLGASSSSVLTSIGEIRQHVHALVDQALPSTLETVKALLEKKSV